MNKDSPGMPDAPRTMRFYHGTRAELRPGDLIRPSVPAEDGEGDGLAAYAYLTPNPDAAIWEAEIAAGDGPGRIYIVQPTGPIEEDPNLTNAKFRGNPTKSFRSRAPLSVTGEIVGWQGHAPEAIKAMKEGLDRLKRLGVGPIED